jgi:hypothetical protein
VLGELAVIRIDIEARLDSLKAFADAARGAPARLLQLVNSELLPSANAEAERQLNAPVGPVRRPFAFESDASRNFYLWAARTGQLPNVGPDGYQRTGQSRTWKISLRNSAGDAFEVVASNDAPYASYVFGPRQVPGHALTGHPNAEAIISQLRPTNRDKVVSLFYRAATPGGR